MKDAQSVYFAFIENKRPSRDHSFEEDLKCHTGIE